MDFALFALCLLMGSWIAFAMVHSMVSIRIGWERKRTNQLLASACLVVYALTMLKKDFSALSNTGLAIAVILMITSTVLCTWWLWTSEKKFLAKK